MALSDYNYIKDLGKGAFGVVCLAEEKFTKEKVAIKRVRLKKLNGQERKNALNEVRILASLCHDNLIDYSLSFLDDASFTLNIVMEYCSRGDIAYAIKNNLKRAKSFEEEEIWTVLMQSLNALAYLQDNKVIHRDIKPANIFLDGEGTVKVGDLNVAKLTELGQANTQTGTPYYASPEIWKEEKYDYKADIWSLGCTVYEMAMLRPPFDGNGLKELSRAIMRGRFTPVSDKYSKDLRLVIAAMLRVDPAKRIDCYSILENKAFRSKVKCELVREGKDRSLVNTIKFNPNVRELNKHLPNRKSSAVNETKPAVNETKPAVNETKPAIKQVRPAVKEIKLTPELPQKKKIVYPIKNVIVEPKVKLPSKKAVDFKKETKTYEKTVVEGQKNLENILRARKEAPKVVKKELKLPKKQLRLLGKDDLKLKQQKNPLKSIFDYK